MNFDEFFKQENQENTGDGTQVSSFEEYLELVERENTRVRVEMKLRKPSVGLYRLGKVKRDMLERLWDEGKPNFPRGWVESPELNSIARQSGTTQQSEFGRRLRELKREQGCDIEISTVGTEGPRYRLNSMKLTPVPRAPFTASQREQLFSSQSYQCQICGTDVVPGAGGRWGAQADHKVPVVRKGTHEPANWQTLCAGCNVAKRRACEGCFEDCQQCPWAFPERFGTVVSIGLPEDLYKAALDQTERRSLPELGALLADALRDKLRNE